MCGYGIGHATPSREEIRPAMPLAALARDLSDAEIELICRQLHRPCRRHRVLTPGVTVRCMAYRGLAPDRSIADTLRHLAAELGPDATTPTPSAFCQARDRLPSGLWPRLLRRKVDDLERRYGRRHLVFGRPLYSVDGSTLSMPDTRSLLGAFGRAKTRHGPSRFPVGRFTVILRHGLETVVDYRLGRYRTGEDEQFHQMWNGLPSGAICLWDTKFGSFYNIATLRARGIDSLGPLHQRRDPERLIRAGRPIGRDEWIVSFGLAPALRRRYLDPTLPETIEVRLIRVRFRRGRQWHTLWLVTTLMDPKQYPRRALVRLYRKRWGIETRFGALKTILHMNVLRSQSAAAIRSEVAASVLAHNLVWTVIHDACHDAPRQAERVSFTSAVRTIVAFSPALRFTDGLARARTYVRMLADIRRHRNPYRPHRIEPRAVKRDPVRYNFLTISRDKARLKCLT